jgi:hypothetical protein
MMDGLFVDLSGDLVRVDDIVVMSPKIEASGSWQAPDKIVGTVVRLRHGGQVETSVTISEIIEEIQSACLPSSP